MLRSYLYPIIKISLVTSLSFVVLAATVLHPLAASAQDTTQSTIQDTINNQVTNPTSTDPTNSVPSNLLNNPTNANSTILSSSDPVPLAATTPSASLVISGNLAQTTTAKVGEVAYRSHAVTITAANITNYTLSISAANGSSANLQLENGPQTLTGAGTKTPALMADNTWGYNWSTSTTPETLSYQTMPVYGKAKAIETATKETENLTKNLTFAAKFASDITPGHYRTKVLLSLVATPKVINSFGVTTMQEMTPTICNSVAVGSSAQLTDARDNKKYWITKLKDNNCWMTQNLALDLTNRTLTASNSNVSANWTTSVNSALWAGAGNYTRVNYYNPGLFIANNHTSLTNCESVAGLSGCTNAGWTNVSNLTPSTDPDFTGNTNGNTYNAHYLSGNYYTWYAATAGTGNSTSSICPKGWQLPNTSGNKSFTGLFTSYGSQNGLLYGAQDIRLSPIYMVHPGQVPSDTTVARLIQAGTMGYYWLNAGSSNMFIPVLNLYNTVTGDSGIVDRGYMVRCVLQ